MKTLFSLLLLTMAGTSLLNASSTRDMDGMEMSTAGHSSRKMSPMNSKMSHMNSEMSPMNSKMSHMDSEMSPMDSEMSRMNS